MSEESKKKCKDNVVKFCHKEYEENGKYGDGYDVEYFKACVDRNAYIYCQSADDILRN